jgi:hypothetical protein
MDAKTYATLVIATLARFDRQCMQIRSADAALARLGAASTPERYEIGAAIKTLGADEAVSVYLAEAERRSPDLVLRSKPEIILAAEALARVGLADLATATEHRWLVEWVGFPKPFSCGHTDVYGFGPLDRPDDPDNEKRGVGRRYQDRVRVSQHYCSGPVLWSWQGVSENSGFRLGTSLVVSFVETVDSKRPCLRIGWSG